MNNLGTDSTTRPPGFESDNYTGSTTLLNYNISNESEIDYSEMFGPRRDALYLVIPITVIYASIFLTGIIGNVSTCIVIARNKSMHTATNYYLFSLAISDLLLLVSGLPPEIYLVWSKYPYIFGETFCVIRGLAAETCTNATVLTITAFTVERYVAICHPFLSHTMSKLSRAIKLILIIWLVALSFAIPQALQFGIVKVSKMNSDFVMCTYKNVILEHSFELSTFLFFLVPMTLITVLYALIGLKLRKSNMMKRDSGNSSGFRKSSSSVKKDRNCRHHTGRSSHRVLKMLGKNYSRVFFDISREFQTGTYLNGISSASLIHFPRILSHYSKGHAGCFLLWSNFTQRILGVNNWLEMLMAV